MPRKKVDQRIRVLIENNVKTRMRSMFVVVGDRAMDQVVVLHHMISKAAVKARPSVLWCYKKDLGFSRTIETVEGGGAIVLLLKKVDSLQQLYTMTMDVHSRYRTAADLEVTPRFNERFILSLTACANCLVIDDELNILPISSATANITPLPPKSSEDSPSESELKLSTLQKSLKDRQPDGVLVDCCKTFDQANVLLQLITRISEKTLSSTTAITAARGRGKSAALGLAVASAVAYGYSNIFVTSPFPENLKTLFEFILKGLDSLGYVKHTDYETTQSTNEEFNKAIVKVAIYRDHRQTIQYIHPTDAHKLGQAELVVIDEAAAIPLPLVKSLMGPHLVFMASTINGYEGTGKSLSFKLFKELRDKTINPVFCKPDREFYELSLEESIRYAEGDLYTPDDLQLLSDSPSHHIFVLLTPEVSGKTLPEVLVVLQKGYGTRALQLLQSYYNGDMTEQEATNETSAFPIIQSQAVSLSSSSTELPPLLSKLSERKPESLDYLGVSYGLTSDLLRFWKKCGFLPVYLRQTQNTLTGENACIMLKVLNTKENASSRIDNMAIDEEKGQRSCEISDKVKLDTQWLRAYSKDFRKRFISLLSSSFRSYHPTLALGLLEQKNILHPDNNRLSATEISFYFSATNMKVLEAFCNNSVDHHHVMELLPHIAKIHFIGKMPDVELNIMEQEVLLGLGLQYELVKLLKKVLKSCFLSLNKVLSQSVNQDLHQQHDLILKSADQSDDQELSKKRAAQVQPMKLKAVQSLTTGR
ncbi:NAT10 [Bugula neritina]|uniref:RNA cytidine acetyltransferase n=1 Tax=Bugula neritina TaxID=10212 RepID=A0A7J7J8Y6_BUGNE|nr:NAT10 [Bugula neritina]